MRCRRGGLLGSGKTAAGILAKRLAVHTSSVGVCDPRKKRWEGKVFDSKGVLKKNCTIIDKGNARDVFVVALVRSRYPDHL